VLLTVKYLFVNGNCPKKETLTHWIKGSTEMYVRASIGTLASLGLLDIKMLEKPYTAYILQYSENGCEAECLFCPQSRVNFSRKDLVSRVVWPRIELEKLIKAIKRKNVFARICVQNVIKPSFEEEFLEIIRNIRRSNIRTPLSASITPVSKELLIKLKELGVDYLGVGLDAASPRVFKIVRKPFTWGKYMDFIRDGIEVFGLRKVDVHLIFGLGESEREFVETMKKIYELGAEIALFAYTPVKGTLLNIKKQPPILSWRKMQIAKHLIESGQESKMFFVGDRVCFEKNFLQQLLKNLEKHVKLFLTTGCPSCNRPFYNESPKGPYYNFPSIPFAKERLAIIREDLEKIIVECEKNGEC